MFQVFTRSRMMVAATGRQQPLREPARNQKVAVNTTDPIVVQIGRNAGEKRFDHNKACGQSSQDKDKLLKGLSAASLANFERLFIRINDTLV
ncbi:MAG: hypothetical protein KGI75_27725 [Rhizobiaceae bacterium]|nr:hypothetical protein [Rhizobiaceae bacterium]